MKPAILEFKDNRVSRLPKAVGNLIELHHLNVSDNRISRISENISGLTKLRVCNLWDAKFSSLPNAFGKVQIANQLRVKNCPIKTLAPGFATMQVTIDSTGTKIDQATMPPQLPAKMNT